MNCYKYDRSAIKAGILHFGVGNFHRAHLEYYTNLLLENPDQSGWGVCGAMIMPSDRRLYDALKAEDGEYELTVCPPNGNNEKYRIGSLVELYLGEDNPQAIIDKVASKDIKIITLTITEGGYAATSREGHSVFWYVAEGLKKRMASKLPLTILSCDNLQHNGDTAREAFMSYFSAKYPDVAAWARENVSFPNSMVDRITPATRSERITDVCCEDFIQWVVEDKFAAGRPDWEKVGVQFTSDVSPYEKMKLSLLNASHSLLCYPAYLEGFRKVDAVLADNSYRTLLELFMNRDVTPYVPAPEGVDLEVYKKTLLERFSNAAISDQVSRLCFDGIAKFKVYIVPTLEKMLRDGKDTVIEAFLVASYYKYVCTAKTEIGEKIKVDEPHMSEDDSKIIATASPRSFLKLSPFASLNLENCHDFLLAYENFCNVSVAQAFEQILK